MNKIDEIALRVAEQIEPRGRTYSPEHYVEVVKLAKAEAKRARKAAKRAADASYNAGGNAP